MHAVVTGGAGFTQHHRLVAEKSREMDTRLTRDVICR